MNDNKVENAALELMSIGPEETREARNRRVSAVQTVLSILMEQDVPAIILFQVPWVPNSEDMMVTSLATVASYEDEIIFLGKFLEQRRVEQGLVTTPEVGHA